MKISQTTHRALHSVWEQPCEPADVPAKLGRTDRSSALCDDQRVNGAGCQSAAHSAPGFKPANSDLTRSSRSAGPSTRPHIQTAQFEAFGPVPVNSGSCRIPSFRLREFHVNLWGRGILQALNLGGTGTGRERYVAPGGFVASPPNCAVGKPKRLSVVVPCSTSKRALANWCGASARPAAASWVTTMS